MKKFILTNTEKEVVMFGEYVGVCRNITEITKTLKDEDGNTYTRKVWKPKGNFYVDFVWVREDEGEVWEDEDSPVAGGFGLRQAKEIVKELQEAIIYLEKEENLI